MTRLVLFVLLFCVALMPVVAEDIIIVTGSPFGEVLIGHGVYIPNAITDSKAIKLLVEGYLDLLDCDYQYGLKTDLTTSSGYIEYQVRIDGAWKIVSESEFNVVFERSSKCRQERISELRKYLNQ
ncbi:hypothetical protein LCGC14_0578340 [marine sediment metagenome]|uniref:Uncharacterized protein n=1 Tax=marine sediment metagenome TaxID=412755 RepID=A0A0F9UQH7_9ZZZZ